jgi:asparagine synthase (glutamine-hydrolysing)
MSGIAGILKLDGAPVEQAALERMVSNLQRRGPDATAIWCNGAIALGQTTLRASPRPTSEKRPYNLGRDNLTITADARLDNRAELIRQLGLPQRDEPTIADEQLILAAYARWGQDCPNMLLGDFAFAIWDEREKLLFCARDHFGVRPLYYYRSCEIFIFASQVRAILSSGMAPRKINEGRVADYLTDELEGVDKTSTFYRDIFRLEPANTITVRGERFSTRRYWTLDTSPPAEYRCDSEYTEAFREVFTEAVRCRLGTGQSTGAMLSGGLDSSSIVAVAQRLRAEQGGGPLRTLSAISANGVDCPESHCIEAVLKRGAFQPFTVTKEQLGNYLDDMSLLLHQCDEPFDLSIAIPQVLYVAARRMNINVVLDGVDGDLVVSLGNAYLAHLLRAGKWKTAFSEGLRRSEFDRTRAVFTLFYRSARRALFPPALSALRRRFGFQRNLNNLVGDSIINRDFARHVGLAARYEALWSHARATCVTNIHEYHAERINHPYLVVALERYDRVASFYSIEPRHPFLDKRLIEFCVRLPWWQCVCDGWTKVILRRATEDLLPNEVCWRRGYEHLGCPFRLSWLGLEKDTVRTLIETDLRDISGYVDVRAVKEAYRRCVSSGWEAGCATGQGDKDAMIVWSAIILALWLHNQRAASS